jgi:hypothetical protein
MKNIVRVILLWAVLEPPHGSAQGWTEITPPGLDEISRFRSFEFDDNNYEIFVWGLSGYRFDSSQRWDSILVSFRSYYCPQGAWEEHYLTEISKGRTNAGITLSLYVESGCITECRTGVYRDTTGLPSGNTQLHSLPDLVCAGIDADVVFSPFDEHTVFMAFADSIYRSTDQGETFVGLSSPSPDLYPFLPVLTTLTLSHFSPNTLLTSTADTLYRSSDGGFTWSRVLHLGNNEWLGVNAVRFHPADSLVAYAACDSGIWKSTDEGVTWVQVLGGTFRCLGVCQDNPVEIFAGRGDGKLFYSSNEGETWSIFNDTFTSSRILGIQDIPRTDTLIIAALDGVFKVYDSFVLSAGDANGGTPQGIRLSQNYPNPFNAATAFSFTNHQSSIINFSVYDLLGREVTTLVNEKLGPGTYTRRWDASGVPSGSYFARLRAGGLVQTRKMMLVR